MLDEKNNFGMNSYMQYIHLSRYSRWIPEKGRRETWTETVGRYFDFFEEHLLENNKFVLTKETRKELEDAVLSLRVMPSMRCLMSAGEALKRENIAGYNCSYVAIDNTRAFDEILYILMNGTGVGFSVEQKYTDQLPIIADEFHHSDTTIVVADSKLGWAKALKELIQLLYSGQIPKTDTSKVRPAGSILKTFGGRASGPGPLNDLFKFCITIFTKAAGRRLTTLECHDIVCKIAEVVVVGGVRRSALISLSDLSDDRMRVAKSGEWWKDNIQRALANNSFVAKEKIDVGIFMKEWLSLYESKSGERGIFSRTASQNQAERFGRRNPDFEFGTNPCCVTGTTPILTSHGYINIEDAVGKSVSIWNGESFEKVVPYEAGESELVRVIFSDGTYLDCTPNHRFVLDGNKFVHADDLRPGDKLHKFDMPTIYEGISYSTDAYSQGFYSADGCKNNNRSYVYEPKYSVINRLVGKILEQEKTTKRRSWVHGQMLAKDFVPMGGTLEYRLNWLAGLIDGDGVAVRYKGGIAIQISSIDKEFLENVRLMLTTLGVQAKIGIMHDASYRSIKQGNFYHHNTTYRILINCVDVLHLSNLGLSTSRVSLDNNVPQRDARRFVRVESIIELNKIEMTYCFSEPKTSRGTFNGIVTGNSEIILRSRQFCNLTEAVVREVDTFSSLADKVRIATILGTIQSTLTNFKYISKKWKENCEEERLLGVSLTGILDNVLTNGKSNMSLQEILENLRQVAVDTNKEWAAKIGIPQSTAVTCVKPSGTVSQLVDAASGIHARHAPYYVRTVRADKKDPLAKMMIEMNFPVEDDVTKPDSTCVFSFPMKAPENSVFRKDMSAIEQLELWLTYQTHWCEHKPSITVSVQEEEWPEVGAWCWKHFDQLSGVSFLPFSDHVYAQAPYQDCTKEEYEAMLAKMPHNIDWTKLAIYEKEDTTTGTQELNCSASGSCEIT